MWVFQNVQPLTRCKQTPKTSGVEKRLLLMGQLCIKDPVAACNVTVLSDHSGVFLIVYIACCGRKSVVTHHTVSVRTIRRRLQQSVLLARHPLLGLHLPQNQTSPPPMVQ
ncbi:hypothetical protein TNCV_5130471 [Trichonephila clavipes]|nr:hypothetical protein TNCV_5130471 [Trichonephila clavipes]